MQRRSGDFSCLSDNKLEPLGVRGWSTDCPSFSSVSWELPYFIHNVQMTGRNYKILTIMNVIEAATVSDNQLKEGPGNREGLSFVFTQHFRHSLGLTLGLHEAKLLYHTSGHHMEPTLHSRVSLHTYWFQHAIRLSPTRTGSSLMSFQSVSLLGSWLVKGQGG